MLTHDQLVDLLRKETNEVGQSRWSREHKCNRLFVNHVLNGSSRMSPKLAAALDYEIRYVKTKTV